MKSMLSAWILILVAAFSFPQTSFAEGSHENGYSYRRPTSAGHKKNHSKKKKHGHRRHAKAAHP